MKVLAVPLVETFFSRKGAKENPWKRVSTLRLCAFA
jgi:hypothetical protein